MRGADVQQLGDVLVRVTGRTRAGGSSDPISKLRLPVDVILLSAGQGRAERTYVDTSTSDDAAMRTKGHDSSGCSAAAATRRRALTVEWLWRYGARPCLRDSVNRP
ncbi:MAG: hypothetical protein C4338_00310 [Rhodanobacteraceae bacterium]